MFALAISATAAIVYLIPQNDDYRDLYRNTSNGWAIVLIVVVGVVPGVSEELFFRGFVQRRLLQRFSPAFAIGITAMLFGLIHVTPQSIALATIMGFWLGVIAWGTNSVWPAALCHAFVNSGWNVYQFGNLKWGWPELTPVWLGVLAGAITVIAFGWSFRILLLQQAKPVLSTPCHTQD